MRLAIRGLETPDVDGPLGIRKRNLCDKLNNSTNCSKKILSSLNVVWHPGDRHVTLMLNPLKPKLV
jgi:hypothetical protein